MTFELPCVPVLKNSCCCGCTVKAGSTILGWCGMVAYFILTVWSALIIVNFDHLGIPRNYHDGIESIYIGILAIYITISLLNGFLLYGIHNEKSCFMLPYLLFSLFLFVFSLLATLYYGISILAHDRVFGLITIFVGPVFYVIAAYFWIILYSYYRQLELKFNSTKGVQYEKYFSDLHIHSTSP